MTSPKVIHLATYKHKKQNNSTSTQQLRAEGARREFKYLLGLVLVKLMKLKGYTDKDIGITINTLATLYAEIIVSIHNEKEIENSL